MDPRQGLLALVLGPVYLLMPSLNPTDRAEMHGGPILALVPMHLDFSPNPVTH